MELQDKSRHKMQCTGVGYLPLFEGERDKPLLGS